MRPSVRPGKVCGKPLSLRTLAQPCPMHKCLLLNAGKGPCCVAGHAYGIRSNTASISWQQGQQADKVGPNISLLSEELQGQRHEQLNEHLGSILIKPHSHCKV